MMLLIYIQRILKQKTEPSTAVSVNESPNNILEGSDVDTVAQEDKTGLSMGNCVLMSLW